MTMRFPPEERNNTFNVIKILIKYYEIETRPAKQISIKDILNGIGRSMKNVSFIRIFLLFFRIKNHRPDAIFSRRNISG